MVRTFTSYNNVTLRRNHSCPNAQQIDFVFPSVTVSNLNSLATCTFEDFLCRLPRFKNYDDEAQLNIIKYVAVAYALVVTMIAFITGFLPGVMETAFITSSATTGPLIGVFILVNMITLDTTEMNR